MCVLCTVCIFVSFVYSLIDVCYSLIDVCYSLIYVCYSLIYVNYSSLVLYNVFLVSFVCIPCKLSNVSSTTRTK